MTFDEAYKIVLQTWKQVQIDNPHELLATGYCFSKATWEIAKADSQRIINRLNDENIRLRNENEQFREALGLNDKTCSITVEQKKRF